MNKYSILTFHLTKKSVWAQREVGRGRGGKSYVTLAPVCFCKCSNSVFCWRVSSVVCPWNSFCKSLWALLNSLLFISKTDRQLTKRTYLNFSCLKCTNLSCAARSSFSNFLSLMTLECCNCCLWLSMAASSVAFFCLWSVSLLIKPWSFQSALASSR
jgi:hypothetical protein